MTICSRTKGYCFQEQYTIVFPIVFGSFCNLIISKQGIKVQFFHKLVVEILKIENGHLPLYLHLSAPRVVIKESFQNHLEIGGG